MVHSLHGHYVQQQFWPFPAWFSSHSCLTFWVLCFTSQSLSMYAQKPAAWPEELDCHFRCGCCLSVIRSLVWSLILASLSLLLVFENFCTYFLHSFLHYILPFCETRCSVRKSSKLFWNTAWNLSWVAGSWSLLMSNHLITWLPFLSLFSLIFILAITILWSLQISTLLWTHIL